MIDAFYSKLEGRGKVLFWVALSFFILALSDRLILGPVLTEIKNLDAEIVAKQEAMQRNLRILSFKESIMTEYSKYEIYLDSGNKSQEEIVSALLRMIETLALQNNIKISNIRPGDVVDNPLYKEYLTSIECEGALIDLLAFMDALEASDFLFRILRYELVPKNKSGESITAKIDISRSLIMAEIMDAAPKKDSLKPIITSDIDIGSEMPVRGLDF